MFLLWAFATHDKVVKIHEFFLVWVAQDSGENGQLWPWYLVTRWLS
jgi:hypothetical protein